MILPIFLAVYLSTTSAAAGSEKCSPAGWSVPPPPDGYTLRQVNAVIRHGDRTPWTGAPCWPNDNAVWQCTLIQAEIPARIPTNGELPHRLYEKVYLNNNEELNGNCSVGQLTSKGYNQHLINGRSLNAAYVKTQFVKALNSYDVWIQSDDMPRTLQSAQALMLGMFPPSPEGEPDLLHINTRDTIYDYMVPNRNLCPKYGEYYDTFNTSQVAKDHVPITTSLMKQLTQVFGISISNIYMLDHIGDCLNTHYCHNMSWPDGATQDLFTDIWQEISWQAYNLAKFPSVEENARVGIGFLLRDIWKNMNKSVSGQQTQKFFLYSGHDTTLLPALVALKVDDGVWPHYAAMILIELYQTPSKDFVVRIIYNGKIVTPAFCDGKPLCDYCTFSQYMMQITPPTNYTDSCKSSFTFE